MLKSNQKIRSSQQQRRNIRQRTTENVERETRRRSLSYLAYGGTSSTDRREASLLILIWRRDQGGRGNLKVLEKVRHQTKKIKEIATLIHGDWSS